MLIKAYDRNKANIRLLNILGDTDEEIIKEIQKEAQKASVTSIRELKQVITEYFAQHSQYPQKKQEEIRHKINLLLKNIKK